jgi:hypothetical protein
MIVRRAVNTSAGLPARATSIRVACTRLLKTLTLLGKGIRIRWLAGSRNPRSIPRRIEPETVELYCIRSGPAV